MKPEKHQRSNQKMPRFTLEGPQPVNNLCFGLIHYAWVSGHFDTKSFDTSRFDTSLKSIRYNLQ